MVKIESDIDIIRKIKEDTTKRHEKITDNQQKLVDSFTSVLPLDVKSAIRENPNINLLYVADKLNLRDLYNESLRCVGFSTSDAIRLLLQSYMSDDDFSKNFEYGWITKNYFNLNPKDRSTIIIESNLGDIKIYKTNLTANSSRVLLLQPYSSIINPSNELNECHLLTYSASKLLGIDATTGNIRDINGQMIHSWCEDGMNSIDIANGYVMNSVDFYKIHNIHDINRVSAGDIIYQDIPPFYDIEDRNKDTYKVRSLAYLWHKKNK